MGFALSHPFARKKAKGWGTEMVQRQAVRDVAGKEDADGDDYVQSGASGRDSPRIPWCGAGGRGSKAAARRAVYPFAAVEWTRVVYSGDGAPALGCVWNRTGDVARFAAAVRFVARRAAQEAQGEEIL